MSKRVIVVSLLVAILFCSIPAYAASKDQPSAWAVPVVNEAISLGLVPQRLQSDYQVPITREEFADLIVQTLFANEKFQADLVKDPVYWTKELFLEKVTVDTEFEDAKEDHVKIAYALGIINGVTDTLFEPNKLITRQEAALMLMNAIHRVTAVMYTDASEFLYAYSDYNKVAEWAKPAVNAISNLLLMRGVGGKFDHLGNFTREQAIITMKRLFDAGPMISLKGNYTIFPQYSELTYNVGKDYARVHLNRSANPRKSSLELNMRSWWEWIDITGKSGVDYDLTKATIIYCFMGELRTEDYFDIHKATLKGQPIKVDYGYMTVQTYADENTILEFRNKPVKGFVSHTNGYTYGYPKVPVEPKVIE